MIQTRRIEVSVLVLREGKDDAAVLYVQRPGETDWTLPGGYVPEGALILEKGTEFLHDPTGAHVPLMTVLALNQSYAIREAGQPETLTFILGTGFATTGELINHVPARWMPFEQAVHAVGIVKYAITAAIHTHRFLRLCLDGEALYTEGERERAQELKEKHEKDQP